jgi:hypothetical protein
MRAVNVLAVMDAAVQVTEANLNLNMLRARVAVAELIEASRAYFDDWCVDEAEDTFEMSRRGTNTGCMREQSDAAKRLGDAIKDC